MATAQSNYNERFAYGANGMVANTEPYNSISRTNSAVLNFGVPVYEGANNHECVPGAAFAATAVGAAVAGNTGAGAITASPAVVSPAKQGVYTIVQITGGATGAFNVYDPQGLIVGDGAVGTEFSGGGLTFTVTDPGADPAIGDRYTVTVTYTANVDFLGLSIRDPSVPALASAPDQYPENYTASIMDFGVMWVTCAGAVVRGAAVYWNPATGLYTASTGILIPGAEYYESATGTLVRVKLRRITG